MRPTTVPRLVRTGLLTALVVVPALIAALVGWSLLAERARSHVVGDATRPGWKTVELDRVRVDIPVSWERASRAGCEFEFERWAPRPDLSCDGAVGVSFYGSATFDAAQEPGVLRRWHDGSRSGWGAYAEAGDLAVDVASPDRELVRRVLASVRRAG